ncbi:MAG TPA: hypothetical protein VFY60_17655 [Pyrinomonadaceae bacterium]|nr:hypothetical protein [Pyrinomonadaceae bacterium]
MLIAISCWFGVKAGGDNLLENDTAQSGIGSLQRAQSVKEAQAVIESWQQQVPERRSQADIEKQYAVTRWFSNQGRTLTEVAKRSLLFDLFFILFYTSVVAVACLLAATEIHCRSSKPKPRLVRLGLRLARLQILTVAFDLIENVAVWRMLSAPVSNPWPWIAYHSSVAKFTVLAVSLFYVFIAFIFWVIDHRRRPIRRTLPVTT